MNRHDRENSSGNGSRVRGSLNRDMTPNKVGKQSTLQTNTSLSSSDMNIVNIKNQGDPKGRNIKTPTTSGQNISSKDVQNYQNIGGAVAQINGQKPTRLSLKMLSQNNK